MSLASSMSSVRAILGSDRFLSRLSAAMFLGGVIASMVAASYSTDYPAIVTDRHNRATNDRHIGASLNRL